NLTWCESENYYRFPLGAKRPRGTGVPREFAPVRSRGGPGEPPRGGEIFLAGGKRGRKRRFRRDPMDRGATPVPRVAAAREWAAAGAEALGGRDAPPDRGRTGARGAVAARERA